MGHILVHIKVKQYFKSGGGLFYDPFWVTAQRKSLTAYTPATVFSFAGKKFEKSNPDYIRDMSGINMLNEFFIIK